MLLILLGNSAQAQTGFIQRVYSEAPVVYENGVKMSTEIIVHFKHQVFDFPAGPVTAKISDMNLEFSNLPIYFSQLEQRFGSISFYKRVPNAVWGDVWRTNRRTGKPVRLHDMSQLYSIRFNQFIPVDSIIAEMEQMEEVLYAEQPLQTARLAEPNDSCYHNPSICEPGAPQNKMWNLVKIEAEKAWDITKGVSSIVVGIIEEGGGLATGIPNRNHEDLSGKFVPGLGSFGSTDPHATFVAGIIGAATNNNTGIASLGWNIMMIPYAFDRGPNFNYNTLENMINQAISDSVEVINCSFVTVAENPNNYGGCDLWQSQSYLNIETAIANAINIGVIVTAGVGNQGAELMANSEHPDCLEILGTSWVIPYYPYPASYPGVIGVSATDEDDIFAGGLSYNYWQSAENQPNFIDVAAPGIDVFSTRGALYAIDKGTSFAAPHVAALAGLILSIDSTFAPDEVQQFITSSALDLGDPKYYGHGRINAYEAIKEAFPIKITGNIDTSTTWVSGDYALIQDYDNNPATPREYYVDNEAILTIESGAVMVVEAGVRLIAIDGSQININPGALICLEPGAEIIAGPGNTHVNVGSMNICFYGTGSCLSTTGGVLKFTSGITFTVNNGGVIAAFESQGGSPSTIEIEDNVSLVFQSNSKLLLEPGALVKLGDNAEIISVDEIDVQGTGTNSITFTSLYQYPQTSQYWKWLKLDGSQDTDPAPQRIFDYATIEYADYGIHATQVSNLAIENSTIQNCRVNNIYLYSSYSYLDNNYISNSGISNGIYLNNSSPLFYNTTINDNTGAGVFCYNYSSPEFGASTSTAYGANVLTGNVYGVSAVYYSNPFLGDEYDIEGPARYGGYNSIYDNSSAAVQALQRCDIIAQYNWWGNYPVEPEIFDIEEDCSIDYDHALTYDPNQESSAIIAGGSVSEQSGFSSLPTENFTPRQLLKLAKKLRVQRLPRLALPVYKQLILNYPNRVEAQWGLLELISTFKEAGRDSAVAYLLQTIATHPNLQMQRVAFDMLTGEYLGKKNANAALSNAQQILGKYPNTESEKIALFNLVNIYFHNLNDPALTQIYFSQLEIKYPNDELTFQAQMLLSGSGVLAKPSNKSRIPFRKPGDKKDGPDLTSKPATFSLSQNYPNPFNPNTTIEFSLPDNQQVDISIFSVNGQRIITLVNGFLERGYHTIQWDSKDERGTPVSSGIYIIRLKAGDKWYARKMMLLK
ncbi:hypothetical protein YTPLAS21_21260 [Candidatus Nitrosocosmicus sp.]|nr:hypothetical protein YTPLAS21_21260 [Candidatus Nitrosocosmicus sp.]